VSPPPPAGTTEPPFMPDMVVGHPSSSVMPLYGHAVSLRLRRANPAKHLCRLEITYLLNKILQFNILTPERMLENRHCRQLCAGLLCLLLPPPGGQPIGLTRPSSGGPCSSPAS